MTQGGHRLAFAYRPQPRSLLLDLAVQAGGWTSVPVADTAEPFQTAAGRDKTHLEPLLQARRCHLWVELQSAPGQESGEAATTICLSRIRRVSQGGQWPQSSVSPPDEPIYLPGTALTANGESGRVLTTDELLEVSRALEDRLPGIEDPAQREIVISYQGLDVESERVLLTWALLRGAAVVLEPDRLSLLQTVFWTRPTLLHGDLELLEELRSRLALLAGPRSSPRRLRRTLGRLRCFLLTEAGDVGGETARFWSELGVAVRSLPRV